MRVALDHLLDFRYIRNALVDALDRLTCLERRMHVLCSLWTSVPNQVQEPVWSLLSEVSWVGVPVLSCSSCSSCVEVLCLQC